jgi:hypothetical protein
MLSRARSQFLAFSLGTVLLVYLVLVFFYQAPLLNNGDYHRITHQLVQIPAYQGLNQACLEIRPDAFFIPSSLASLVFEINVGFTNLIGQTCWSLESYFLILASIYCIGLYRCIATSLPLPTLIGLLVAPLFFSPFFKSLYEEGIVLALLPWVILGIYRLRTQGKVLEFTITSALLLLAKTQLVLLAPAMLYAIFLYGRALKLPTLKIIFVSGILLLAVAGSLYQKQKQEDGLANAYNRLFNGIGWSMQSVHSWPANHFSGRLQYFSSHQDELQEITKDAELVPNLNLWGTSFWPTGLELLTSGNDQRWENIDRQLNPKSFLKFFYIHPSALIQYLQNGVLVFTNSNYALGALQEILPSLIGTGLTVLNNYSLQSVIWLYALLLIYCLLSRSGFGRLLSIGILIGAPFTVLIGDGYFEFEKHLMPYFLTLPLLLLFIPSKNRL